MDVVAFFLGTLGDTTIINAGGEVHHHYKNDVVAVRDQADLFAIAGETFAVPTSWKDRGEFVTKAEFLAAVRRQALRFESLCDHPQHPRRPEAFYFGPANATLPEPTGQALETLLNFYSPATPLDRHLLAAAFITPYWGYWEAPMFVIDATTGRNAGKSTIPHHIAHLLGQVPVEISTRGGIDGERLRRRLVVGEGRRRSILLVDNVDDVLHSPDLSSMITSPVVSAMPNHGREECHRARDFMIFTTMNDAVADADLADRSYFIYLRHPKIRDAQWDRTVRQFMDEHRLELWSDILDLLRRSPEFTPTTVSTRFGAFQRSVLAAACRDQRTFDEVLALTVHRQRESDRDGDCVAEVGLLADNYVRSLLPKRNLAFESTVVGVTNAAVLRLYRAATGDGRATQQRASKVLRRAISAGKLPRLEVPLDGKLDAQSRGLVWRGPAAGKDAPCDFIAELKDDLTQGLLGQTAVQADARGGSRGSATTEGSGQGGAGRRQQDSNRKLLSALPSMRK